MCCEDTAIHNSCEDELEALFKWGDQIAKKTKLTSEKLRRYLLEVVQELSEVNGMPEDIHDAHRDTSKLEAHLSQLELKDQVIVLKHLLDMANERIKELEKQLEDSRKETVAIINLTRAYLGAEEAINTGIEGLTKLLDTMSKMGSNAS